MPFINSVRSVFETMVKVPTKVCRPVAKSDPDVLYEVSSVIGFSGDVVGNVVISLQLRAATKLLCSFAGAEIQPDSPDFADGIGELANMIAGGAKQHLGNAASITIPSVLIGKGHQVARLTGVPSIVIPCQTPVGDFAVEVNIKKVPPSQPTAVAPGNPTCQRRILMRVLIVDDSKVMRSVQKKALDSLGQVEFCEAGDGVEALAAIAAAPAPFDLILVDWNMPNMDGITLVGRIRETDRRTPVVMCTTEAERQRVMDAIKAGVSNYVIKPFTPESIIEKVRKVLPASA